MAKHFARVKETTTTTGTGTLTRAGAETGFRAFDVVYAVGEYAPYWLIAADGTWERGWGYRTTATNWVRDVIDESSNGGSAINLPAGTHTLMVGPNPAADSHRGALLKLTLSSQSIPTGVFGGSETAIGFDGGEYDTEDPAPAFPKFEILLPDWVSKIRLSASVRFSGSTAGTFREAFISGDDEFGKAPGLPWAIIEPKADAGRDIILLNSGVIERNFDSFRLYVNHDAGVAINAFAGNNTWLACEYLE